jgi:2-hydroxycyclohexanecarboxyl-CoA dehydrogenase
MAIFDQQGDALKAHVSALQDKGFAALGFEVDVTDRPAVDAAVASVRREFGPISIVVDRIVD